MEPNFKNFPIKIQICGYLWQSIYIILSSMTWVVCSAVPIVNNQGQFLENIFFPSAISLQGRMNMSFLTKHILGPNFQDVAQEMTNFLELHNLILSVATEGAASAALSDPCIDPNSSTTSAVANSCFIPYFLVSKTTFKVIDEFSIIDNYLASLYSYLIRLGIF